MLGYDEMPLTHDSQCDSCMRCSDEVLCNWPISRFRLIALHMSPDEISVAVYISRSFRPLLAQEYRDAVLDSRISRSFNPFRMP